ncbi:MAG TPA: endo-1,4-beta-xylanase [Verrucomicrobiae bacterium]|nr:endo-1,4-beta-xylanase [Verrucomicrobiae bacterium]
MATVLAANANAQTTLKDAFKKDFMVGVAVNQNQFTYKDTNGAALIAAQFNAISPENVMKWESIHPKPGADGYNFGPADAYVAFGEKHNMFIVGHTLVWHNQTPRWVFEDENGRPLGTNSADRALLLQRMHDHIQTVVSRYKGRIKVWDVVNEALNDSSNMSDTNILRRNSPWVRILGMDFIVKAFQYAHEADLDAILRYNDYSIENPAKRARLIKLIKYLQSQNVPVGAIGSQTHANLSWPSPELEDSFLTEVGKLGLPIHITELDVNAAQGGQRSQSADITQNAQANSGLTGPDTLAQQQLTKQYSNLFTQFLKHRDSIKLVTLWGVTDADSWRKNGKPLLFDGNWQPKPAFDAVVRLAAGQ